MNAGETFHAPSPDSSIKHLWIAVTVPDANGNQVIVNVSKQGEGKDQSCILNVGDHPWLSRESIIFYAEAKITNAGAVSSAAKGRVIEYDAEVTADALTRIREGALVSPHTPGKVLAMIKTALGV